MISGLYIEERNQKGRYPLSRDLAYHLYARRGRAVVATDEPLSLMPAVKKQWLKIMRLVQREQARTTDVTLILAFAKIIAYMQARRFSHKPPQECPGADVYFLTREQLIELSPICSTLYFTKAPGVADLETFSEFMPPGGAIVVYTLKATETLTERVGSPKRMRWANYDFAMNAVSFVVDFC